MIKTLLTKAGFVDITENRDGTVNATKDGVRYSKMYVSDWKPGTSDEVVTQDVGMIMCPETFWVK